MHTQKELKGLVYHKILEELDRKIEVIRGAIASAKDSRKSDQKQKREWFL
jgi:hypothetical protein